MIDANHDISKPYYQAVSEDILSGHSMFNFVGSFGYTVGLHSFGYVYAIYGPAKIGITDEWSGTVDIEIKDRTFFKFPIKVYPEGIIKVETDDNTLTQILIKDEY